MRKILVIIALGMVFASSASAGDGYRYFDRTLDAVERLAAYRYHHDRYRNRRPPRMHGHPGHVHGPDCGYGRYCGRPRVSDSCGDRCGSRVRPERYQSKVYADDHAGQCPPDKQLVRDVDCVSIGAGVTRCYHACR